MGKSALTIQIVCPAKPGTVFGNRITALRWQRVFKELGHRPKIVGAYAGRCDLLIALHAKRSADSIHRFHQNQPQQPIILGVTGTDLYRDGRTPETARSLQLADAIVTLQAAAIDDLPVKFRRKSRAIYQSVSPLQTVRPTQPRSRRVIVAAHLRRLKDPFRAAMAVRNLPAASKIVVEQYGRVIEAPLKAQAQAEMKKNNRYRWFGEISRGLLRQRLAKCWLMVLSSKCEGGANVVSESIVDHTVVLASHIAGNIGLLGDDYRGYFTVGDTRGLRDLLLRCEEEPSFHTSLRQQIEVRAPLFKPAAEKAAWKKLLAELV